MRPGALQVPDLSSPAAHQAAHRPDVADPLQPKQIYLRVTSPTRNSEEAKDMWWTIAFTYGALMTLFGPVIGPPADRAIGFGWPLFLIALPTICLKVLTWKLAALHVLAAWTPLLISSLLAPPKSALSFIGVSLVPIVSGLSLAVGAAANVLAYRVI